MDNDDDDDGPGPPPLGSSLPARRRSDVLADRSVSYEALGHYEIIIKSDRRRSNDNDESATAAAAAASRSHVPAAPRNDEAISKIVEEIMGSEEDSPIKNSATEEEEENENNYDDDDDDDDDDDYDDAKSPPGSPLPPNAPSLAKRSFRPMEETSNRALKPGGDDEAAAASSKMDTNQEDCPNKEEENISSSSMASMSTNPNNGNNAKEEIQLSSSSSSSSSCSGMEDRGVRWMVERYESKKGAVEEETVEQQRVQTEVPTMVTVSSSTKSFLHIGDVEVGSNDESSNDNDSTNSTSFEDATAAIDRSDITSPSIPPSEPPSSSSSSSESLRHSAPAAEADEPSNDDDEERRSSSPSEPAPSSESMMAHCSESSPEPLNDEERSSMARQVLFAGRNLFLRTTSRVGADRDDDAVEAVDDANFATPEKRPTAATPESPAGNGGNSIAEGDEEDAAVPDSMKKLFRDADSALQRALTPEAGNDGARAKYYDVAEDAYCEDYYVSPKKGRSTISSSSSNAANKTTANRATMSPSSHPLPPSYYDASSSSSMDDSDKFAENELMPPELRFSDEEECVNAPSTGHQQNNANVVNPRRRERRIYYCSLATLMLLNIVGMVVLITLGGNNDSNDSSENDDVSDERNKGNDEWIQDDGASIGHNAPYHAVMASITPSSVPSQYVENEENEDNADTVQHAPYYAIMASITPSSVPSNVPSVSTQPSMQQAQPSVRPSSNDSYQPTSFNQNLVKPISTMPTGLRPTAQPTLSASPIHSDSNPTTKPEEPPSSMPTVQSIIRLPPTSSTTAASCYPIEINIAFDSAPFGSGYALKQIGIATSIDEFFPPDDVQYANAQYTNSLCLTPGRYQFTMYDYVGNGLCCENGVGSYSVEQQQQHDEYEEVIVLAEGGAFEYREETLFEIPSAG